MSQPSEHSAEQALDGLRREIDDADRALVALLARRREVARRMRQLKASHALPRLDGEREAAVRAHVLAEGARLSVPARLLDMVISAVLEDSRAVVMSEVDAP